MLKNEPKRPMSLTILIIFILCFAAWNGLRIKEVIFFWKSLEEYGAHSLYISMSGGIWFLIGLILVWSLWKGKNWGWIATFGTAVSYTAWYWLDRLVLQKPHANWLFALILNICILLLIILFMFSQKMRHYFKKDSYERKSKTAAP
jgi:hypothetical protein